VSTIKAPPIQKIIVSQFITAVLLAVVGYGTQDLVVAYSLLSGGLICAIPNAYFSIKAFQHRGARAAKKIVKAFYVGEGIKILLTCAGFALVFAYVKPLSTPALFFRFRSCIFDRLGLVDRDGNEEARNLSPPKFTFI